MCGRLKFQLYSCTYIGSGYSDWKEDSRYCNHECALDIPKLKEIVESSTWSIFKIRISVSQTDWTDLVLFEHGVTLEYLAKLAISKDPLSLVGIRVIDEEKEQC